MTGRWSAEAQFRPLGLDTRAINTLVREGITSLADLQALSEREIARIRGIGPLAIEKIRAHLRADAIAAIVQPRARALSIQFDAVYLRAIGTWAESQGDPLSRAEAVRRLVGFALTTEIQNASIANLPGDWNFESAPHYQKMPLAKCG